jgi:3-hydroxyacyl-CoA dehydrogenase / 3-hydroxy-2-methylbutyryl-CoA dehydrogenase
MSFKWCKAKAIVSGGASGLGRAVAESVVAAGGQVVLLDCDVKAGEATVKELGSQAYFMAVDVTDAAALLRVVEQANKQLDSVDLTVCCAGIAPSARLLGRDGLHEAELFLRVLAVNLTGTFNLARAIAAVMKNNQPDEQGARGVIVMTSSIAADDGQIGQAAYAASKGGVASMTLPLARELSRIGVRVMCIAPGLFDTPMSQSFSEQLRENLAQQVPFPQRLGLPEEYAHLIKSIYENGYLNGETIRLDGALRMPVK